MGHGKGGVKERRTFSRAPEFLGRALSFQQSSLGSHVAVFLAMVVVGFVAIPPDLQHQGSASTTLIGALVFLAFLCNLGTSSC